MVGQPGFFDLDERYRALAETGDPLIKLAELIEFEVFRSPLLRALARSDGSRGGRPPYDPVLMCSSWNLIGQLVSGDWSAPPVGS